MLSVIIISLLFLVPFIYLPFGFSYFETPKVVISEILIGISAILFLIKRPSLSEIRKVKPLLVILGVTALLSLINLFLNLTPTVFIGNIFRLQGTFFLWNMLFFCLLAATSKINLNQKLLIGLFIVHSLLIFLFGTNIDGRIIGTLGEPNSLAAYFLFFWPLILVSKKSNLKHLALLLPLVFTITIFSGSRSAMIGLISQVVFIATYKVTNNKYYSVILAYTLILLSYLLPFIDIGGQFQVRSMIWKTALVAGLQRIFTGYGFGNVDFALQNAATLMQNNLRFEYVDSSHNLFLDYFVQSGIVGLLMLFIIIALTTINYISSSKENIFYMISFLGLLTSMSFNPMSIAIYIPFFWLIGNSFQISSGTKS